MSKQKMTNDKLLISILTTITTSMTNIDSFNVLMDTNHCSVIVTNNNLINQNRNEPRYASVTHPSNKPFQIVYLHS